MNRLSHRQVRRNRARSLLVLFLLLSASFASVVAPAASAQPLCLDGKIWDADAEECVAIDEDEPPADDSTEDDEDQQPPDDGDEGDSSEGTVAPEDGEEEDTTLKPERDTFGEITAWVFDCPAGLDIQVTEPDLMHTSCEPHLTNIQFELDLDGLISNSSTNTLGRTTYTSVPPGQYRLRIVLPEGSDSPVVFCTVSGPSGQTLENYDRFDVSNTGSIGLGMDAMEFAACDFFLSGDATGSEDAVASETELLPPGFPADAPVADASLEAAPGTAYINIYKLSCPEEFDPGPDAPVDQCYGREQEGVGFSVIANNDTVGSAVTAASGFVTFSDVPAGEIVVQEALPLGYGKPMVGCTLVDTPSGTKVRDYQLYVASADGTVVFSGIEENQGLYCIWFNIPTSATGSIDAVAWSCPEGYDIYTKGPDELIGDCGQKLDGVEFQLQHPTEGISLQYTSGLRSTAYFRNISPGQLTLRESMPSGYGVPVVFCEVSGPQGQTIDQYDRYDVSNSASVQLGMDEFDAFRCDFFQSTSGLPVETTIGTDQQEGFPPPTQVPSFTDDIVGIDDVEGVELPDDTPGEVTLVKHECPVGFDAYNATANAINLTCEYVRETIYEFSLNDSAGGFQNLHTAIKDPLVEFEAVAPGAVSIMESVPPGFGEPVIYCQTLPSGGEATPYELQPIVNANTLQITLPAAGWVACDWFNVPEGAPAPNPADDAVVDPNLGDLPLEIIEATGSEGGSASVALVEEGTIGLHIFNYECQRGVDVTGLDYLALIDVCGETIPGVDFNVAINGSQVATLTTSGAPAYLFSSDIPAGDMTITEVVPRGFGTPIVYCYVVRDGAVVRDWVPYAVSGSSVDVADLTTPDVTYCGWFNIPSDASILVDTIAYICPGAVDASLTLYEELITTCGSPNTEIEFQLLRGTTVIGSQHTNLGLARFASIEPGSLVLQEFVPEGYGQPIVFCTVLGPEGQTYRSRDYYFLNGDGSIDIDNLQTFSTVFCEWFNVPVSADSGTAQSHAVFAQFPGAALRPDAA